MNIVKDMIDIGNATSIGNNSDGKNIILSSAVDNTTIEMISFDATNGNNLNISNSWKSTTYVNGFDIETIALLVMFIVCAMIYASKYCSKIK